jgi:hypothetical protein
MAQHCPIIGHPVVLSALANALLVLAKAKLLDELRLELLAKAKLLELLVEELEAETAES